MTSNLETALRSTVSHAALSASVAFSWTAMSDNASAQQSGTVSLDTISVVGADTAGSYNVRTLSSPKQTAPLLDTPATVTVVPQQIIRERGATDLTEVLRNTPGITFDAGENGFGTSMTNFKLRGFNASGDVFIDGSRDNGTYARDMFNVERVEIFKGPAADNGRGSAGGYINIVTKVPTLQNFFAGEASLGFDEYSSIMRKRATIDFNHVLNENWAFRFNGLLEDSGVAGRDIAEAKPRGLAPSLAYGLGTNFRALLSYEMQRRRDLPDWGVPAATVRGMMRFDPVAGTAPRDAFYGLRSDLDDTDADALRARFEYDFSKTATISNQTRWSRVDRVSRFTDLAATPFTTTPLPANLNTLVNTQTLFYDRTTETLTNLTNFSAEFFTGPVRHNLSTGLELSDEQSDNRRQPAVTTPVAGYATRLFFPNPDRRPAVPFNPTQWSSVNVKTIAAYVYDTVHLTPQWELMGGLRAEHYKVDIVDSTGVNNFNTTETTLGGKFGVVYKPARNGSVYAAVGLSHQPPGSYLSNPDISRVGEDGFPNLVRGADPVRSINYEIGTKWDFFNGRLSTTAALFHTDKRVPITGCTTVVTTPNPCRDLDPLKGYGNQIAQGVELGIAGNITEEWKVFGGVLLMTTERQHAAYLDLLRSNANRADYGCSTTPAVPCRVSTNGDQLAFTPKVSANLWTTYRIPQTPWTVGGGMQYVGDSYAGRPDDAARIIRNGVFGELPSYFLVHLMTAYEIRKDVDIRFNVDNVADTKYAVSSNWPAQRVMLGAPRTYRVSTSFKF